MAVVKVLKIGTNGVPTEQASGDDASFNSYNVGSPSTHGLVATAGEIAFDNVVAKERDNVFTTAGALLFPTISDSAGQVDALRLPQLAGVPSATPTASGEGFLVWDSTDDRLYAWTGSAWSNAFVSASSTPIVVDSTTFVADTGGVSIRNALYISAAGKVKPADNTSASTAGLMGFATNTASATNAVNVQYAGVLGGFSSLTAGAIEYLGTSGALTETVPSASGSTIVQAGYAASTTQLLIQMQFLGVRA